MKMSDQQLLLGLAIRWVQLSWVHDSVGCVGLIDEH